MGEEFEVGKAYRIELWSWPAPEEVTVTKATEDRVWYRREGARRVASVTAHTFSHAIAAARARA